MNLKKEEENYCVQPEKCMEIPICRLRYIRDFGIYMEIYMNQMEQSSGLQTRFFIGCVLFLIFVLMDYFHLEIAQVDSEEVVQMVEQDANAVESWSDLNIK